MVVTYRTWALLGVVMVLLLVGVGAGTYWWTVRNATAVEPVEHASQVELAASASDAGDAGLPDLFTPPADIPALIREVTSETVVIECGEEDYGSGWVINTTAKPVIRNEEFAANAANLDGLVITALHVVENCRDNPRDIKVFIGGIAVRSQILNWHKKVDLAILAAATGTPGLEPTFTTASGAWVLAVGAPFYDQLTPTIGRTITTEGNDLFSDILTNTGNSGGPLVNTQGQIVGTVTAGLLDDETGMNLNVSVATISRALCLKLLDCSDS